MIDYDPNINDTLAEQCALDNTTEEASSQIVFSTQPVLFIKWTNISSGKIMLQLVKLSGKYKNLDLIKLINAKKIK